MGSGECPSGAVADGGQTTGDMPHRPVTDQSTVFGETTGEPTSIWTTWWEPRVMSRGSPVYRRPSTNTTIDPLADATWVRLSGCCQMSKSCPRVYVCLVGDSMWMMPSWTWTCSQ